MGCCSPRGGLTLTGASRGHAGQRRGPRARFSGGGNGSRTERPTHNAGTHTDTVWARVGAVIVDAIVVTEDDAPCETDDAIVRNLLRFVDALPAVSLLGAIFVFVSNEDQRPDDLAAETVVAPVEKGWK